MNEIARTSGYRETAVPSPYTDRKALSEAWYRALYGPQAPSNARPATARPPTPSNDSVPRDSDVALTKARPAEVRRAPTSFSAHQRLVAGNATIRRARLEHGYRLPPSTSGLRAAVARRTLLRCAGARGEGIDLLVQQRGRRLHIVALAVSAESRARIADALRRARLALAARGLHLDIDVREKGTA